jgi:putative ABC transport system permease protein
MHIVKLLTVDFLRWVLLAGVLSVPIIYYSAQQWLQGFAYRVEPGFMTYVGGSLVAVFVALLTVVWVAVRAARMNPVETLRCE